MKSPDGEEHDVSGIYREVIPNQKLVFTWSWKSTRKRDRRVTQLNIKPDGDGTIFTLQHEQFFDEDARDRHQGGSKTARWTSSTSTSPHSDRSSLCPHEWSHGEFYWNELMTRDGERAKKFYADTLGWNFEAMAMPDGTYWVAKWETNCRRIISVEQPAIRRCPGRLDVLYRRR